MNLDKRPLLKNVVDKDERAKKEEEKVAKGKEKLKALDAKKTVDGLRADQERAEASRYASVKEAEERRKETEGRRAKLAKELNS